MFFYLFLLELLIILILIVAIDFEEKKDFLCLSIFILIILLVGVYFMDNKIIKIVGFALSCVIAVCIMTYLCFVIFTKQTRNILSTDNEHFYLNGQKLEDVYFISDENDKVPAETKNVIVVNNIALNESMFEDKGVTKVKKIYFLSSILAIDSELYNKIKNKMEFISTRNQCFLVEIKKEDNSNTTESTTSDDSSTKSNNQDIKN